MFDEKRAADILKEYWGYDGFRGIQQKIIASICDGRDTLGLMPTGGGKSICFQVPALMMEGLCIVVTPLISLMKDQVNRLRGLGIKADAVYSGMSRDDIDRVLDNCILGDYRFLYISPERIGTQLFMNKLGHMRNIKLITVDEAHCVSQWGYDFRPSYLQVRRIRELIKYEVPMLALTATATPKVVDDIQQQLGFRQKNMFSMSFARRNLAYVVRPSEDKVGDIVQILKRYTEGSAIVYTRNRMMTREIAKVLRNEGISADNYHAGLSDAEKDFRQINWTKNRNRVMVATNAFGMGIDKPDVRMVIHYNVPDSIEAYFQEAGRAGRDGNKAYAVLLYSRGDKPTLHRRVPETYPEPEYVRKTYENVSYFLQVGEGEALGRTFDFSLEQFCLRFKQFAVPVSSSLKLLNNAGYIEYCEDHNYKSRLHFVLRKEELYKLHTKDDDLDSLINCVLRIYPGVFADFVYVDEMSISHFTGMSPDRVYDLLKELTSRRILDYIPHKNTPTITYRTPRVDPQTIALHRMIYDDRKRDYAERIESMLEYASSGVKCRSRMLLRYFGESDSQDCGMCDVCVAKRKRGFTHEQVEETKALIRAKLNEDENYLKTDMRDLCVDRELLAEALRDVKS